MAGAHAKAMSILGRMPAAAQLDSQLHMIFCGAPPHLMPPTGTVKMAWPWVRPERTRCAFSAWR